MNSKGNWNKIEGNQQKQKRLVKEMLPWGMISGFFSMLSLLSAHKSRATSCDDCNVRWVLSAYDAVSLRSLLPPVDWSPNTSLVLLLLLRLARFRMINTTMIAVIAIAPAHPNSTNGTNIFRLASDGVDASNDDVSVCFSGLFRVDARSTVELLRPFAFWAIKNTL